MSNLRSLRKPLWELTKQEQLNLHEEIRVSRKVAKVSVKARAVKQNKATNKINKAVSSLTPEQAALILERLKAEGRI